VITAFIGICHELRVIELARPYESVRNAALPAEFLDYTPVAIWKTRRIRCCCQHAIAQFLMPCCNQDSRIDSTGKSNDGAFNLSKAPSEIFHLFIEFIQHFAFRIHCRSSPTVSAI